MADDNVSATRVIHASAEAIFAVLTDPVKRVAIECTDWVCESLDHKPLTATGQIFRVSMYHLDHPDGNYKIANRVRVFDPPRTISWEPGIEAGDGSLSSGGCVWRCDLRPAGPTNTAVTFSCDWLAVAVAIRPYAGFRPFRLEHLGKSLAQLTELVAS